MAVPAAVPALAPASYNAFMNFKRRQMYKQNAEQQGAQEDIDGQQAGVDEIMNEHPGMRELQRQMQGIIQRAGDSGDADKIEGVAILQDMLNNEAGSYIKYFMMANDEDKDDIIKEIKTLMINLARKEQADGKLRDERPEAGSDRDGELGNASDQANGKIERMQDRLETRHEKNLNIPDAGELKAGTDYPKKVEGEDVTYNLKPMERAPSQTWWANEANKALRNTEADFRNPQTFVAVDWDVNNSDEEKKFDTEGNRNRMTGRERKRAALNAVSTWKNDVLPQLQPGMVLMANPLDDDDEKAMARKDGRNQRERIYQLAGFGGTQDDNMAAVVVRDENGNNKLIPLNPTREQEDREKKIEENYIGLIHRDLNNLEVEVAYDMLFS